MATKNRILFLMQYLQENTDENRAVTTAQIREEMERRGCPIIISTLRDDIESLQRAGYDIQVTEQEGMPTTYSWLDRAWSQPELQILVDAVSSCQFLTVEKSRELIGKLVRMGAPSLRESLKPQILVSEHVKAPNRQILLSVQAIRRAMDQNRKISFRYLQYDPYKQQAPKYQGTPEEEHVVSPYATIWNSDRYYLVGFYEKTHDVNTFRIDRMTKVKQLRYKRVEQPDDFNIQDYTDKVFWMYKGFEEEVTLRCQRHLMDQVIDKFGIDVKVTRIRKETFDITVPVHVSKTFYAWVNQFAGEMTIIAPDHVRQTYAEHLQKAIDDVLGD